MSHVIKRLLLLILFSVPICLVGNNRCLWAIVIVAMWMLTMLLFLIAFKKPSNKYITRFVCDGSFSIHMSLLLLFLSYKLITIDLDDSLLLLSIMLLLFLMVIALFLFITYLNIKKGAFTVQRANRVNMFIPIIFGVSGMITARVILVDQSQDNLIMFVAFVLLLLSLLLSIGSINILRAILFYKYQIYLNK